MTEYKRKKEEARQAAIDYQLNFDKYVHDYFDFVYYTRFWERIGGKYGLTREFKENGII